MVDRKDDRMHGGYRRIEVIADGGRRRRWSDDEKAAIVLESLQSGAVVTEIARRRGVRAQQIHGWRRDAREGRLALPGDDPRLAFAPVVVDAAPAPEARLGEAPIEIEADGIVMRVRAGADARLVSALVRLLKERA